MKVIIRILKKILKRNSHNVIEGSEIFIMIFNVSTVCYNYDTFMK